MEEGTQSVEKRILRKGAWSPEEDRKLIAYINRYGIWNWKEMAKPAGLQRSGKSCRLRWVNYLKPGIKHGNFTREEEDIIIELREGLGNGWSVIASRLPGRTDNGIKNYWHTHLSKRFKYNSVPTSKLRQISNVETEQKSSSQIDLPPVNAPEASNSESCGATIQVSPQVSTHDILLPASSYSNQATEETDVGSSESFGELQSILEQPIFTVKGSDAAENYDGGEVPRVHVSGNSRNDVWLSPLMKENIYEGQ